MFYRTFARHQWLIRLFLHFLAAGYEGTWVCEKDNEKALEMYKEWKEGKK